MPLILFHISLHLPRSGQPVRVNHLLLALEINQVDRMRLDVVAPFAVDTAEDALTDVRGEVADHVDDVARGE